MHETTRHAGERERRGEDCDLFYGWEGALGNEVVDMIGKMYLKYLKYMAYAVQVK